jgi:hypothetical protein
MATILLRPGMGRVRPVFSAGRRYGYVADACGVESGNNGVVFSNEVTKEERALTASKYFAIIFIFSPSL